MSEVAVSRSPTVTQKLVLCPYCGHAQGASKSNRCNDCGGLFEPLSRRATQIAMGPWTVRDKAHPFRPGCSYPVLVKMIEAGRVTPTTVLRGPTTRQFWSVARNVPGVAHLLGYCHNCGFHVDPEAKLCPKCETPFKKVRTRNELGLQFATQRAADAAQRSLERHLDAAAGKRPSGDGVEVEVELADHRGGAADAAGAGLSGVAESGVAEPGAGGPGAGDPGASVAAPMAGETGTGDLIDDLLGEVGAAAGGREESVDLRALADPGAAELVEPSEPAAALPAPVRSRSRSRSVDADAASPAPPAPTSEAAPLPAPPSPAVRAPSALAASPAAKPNWTLWLLIALNVIVVAAVLAYMLLNV